MSNVSMYDVIIIGGGTAGLTAAIYTARKKLNTLVLAFEFGGQTAWQPEIYNYPGFLEKDGLKLMNNMKKQVLDLGVETKSSAGISKISAKEAPEHHEIFIIEDKNGSVHEARSVIIASGKQPRKLGIEGEKEFMNKGVTYCATCDAPLFKDKVTAVIGAGNSGLDAAMQLTKYAKKVYVLAKSEDVKGDRITYDKLLQTPLAEFVFSAMIQKIQGEQFVTGITYKELKTGEEKQLGVDGIFVAIGMMPNSDFVKELCELNQWGEIVINPKTNATSHVGIFAAGDVTDVLEKQTIIAAGEGAKAALQCYKWLQSQY